jgi:hypothetical protein
MPSSPVALAPSYYAPTGIVGNNSPENPIKRDNENPNTRDIQVTKKLVSKTAKAAALSVSFSISTSPVPNADDAFIDSLFTHGGINNNNDGLPPPMPQKKKYY